MYQNENNSLPLFLSLKQKVFYFLLCFIVFASFLSFEYFEYLDFIQDELYNDNFEIVNIYNKTKYNKNYLILKLKNDNFHFYAPVYFDINTYKNTKITKSNKTLNDKYKIGNNINIFVLSKNISFIKFLSGFYTKITDISYFNSLSLSPDTISYANVVNMQHKNKKTIAINQAVKIPKTQNSFKLELKQLIYNQHQNKQIANLFSTLFLATPLHKANREFATIFHISHLLAISGFHIAFLIAIFSFLYAILTNKLYAKFAPYSNRIFHSLIIATILVFAYLFLTSFPPSLIRAFFMFVFALVFLYSNIKIFSFFSLIVVVSFILALFPKLLFSLSFWFSLSGVFYIFLFIEYFSKLNKTLFAFILNFWLFFALLPIAHFYFYHFSLYAFFAPIATLLFYIFYPIMLLTHLVGWGGFFDEYIILALSQSPKLSIFAPTPNLFFYIFVSFSFLSIYFKIAFYILNALIAYFVFYLLYLLYLS
jgi:competence protein ComEC